MDGTGGNCAVGRAFDTTFSVTVSPNGKSVYVPAIDSTSVAILKRKKKTGAVRQRKSKTGCVSADGSDGDSGACIEAPSLSSARAAAVSPDGKNVYVVSSDVNTITVFRRLGSGVLFPLTGTAGCVTEEVDNVSCTGGKGLEEVFAVAVSPDGKHVYVASLLSDAVAIFTRDSKTGALSQLAGLDGCISEDGSGGECTDGKGLDGARAITVSPDGNHVYVASNVSNAIAVFSRNLNTGVLSQLANLDGCISEDGSGGACADGKGLNKVQGITVSPDGKHVYAASFMSDAVAAFTRDSSTGALSQLAGLDGCISEDGSGGACTDGKGLDGATAVVVSPDGANVYVASRTGNAVAVFARNAISGVLSQLLGTAGCVSVDGSGGLCTQGKGLAGVLAVAISPDGKHVYTASFSDEAVAVFNRN
jgi:DNA-binding beta-propeller fold protein YncE